SLRSGLISSAILTQFGAYLTPLVLDTGADQQTVLMVYTCIVTVGFLTVAVLSWWQALAPLALVGATSLFATWTWQRWEPVDFATTMVYAWVLGSAFFVYAVGAPLLRRAANLMGAVILVAGGMLMVALVLATAPNDAVMFAHLFVLDAVVVAACWARGWLWPLQVALSWTVLGFGGSSQTRIEPLQGAAWGWAFFLLLGIGALGGLRRRVSRAADVINALVFTEASVGLSAWLIGTVMATRMAMSPETLLANLLVLAAATLAAAHLRQWTITRVIALAAAAAGVTLAIVGVEVDGLTLSETAPLAGCVWVWVFFGWFTLDVWVRLKTSASATARWLDASLIAAASGLMFAGTWGLLDGVWDDRVIAIYTAGFAAAAILAAVFLRRLTDRRTLSYAYLGIGLTLAAFVAPMALDNMGVTIAWSAQAAVCMLLASRLKDRMLFIKAPALLVAALIHYLATDIYAAGGDRVLMTLWGVDVTFLLMTAAALTVGIVLTVLLQMAREPFNRGWYTFVAVQLGVVACLFWAAQTVLHLSPITATWWSLGLALAWAAAGICPRLLLRVLAGAMLLACGAKFILFDTLTVRMDDGVDTTRWIVANFQALLGVALATAALLAARLGRRHAAFKPWAVLLVLLAAVLIVWTGSFEIDRGFAVRRARATEDLEQARHMAYSVWWGLCAVAMIIIGLMVKYAPVRYLALGLVALTLGKVFLVDMANVETVWRIVSFVAVGLVLLGGSLAYHRYFGRLAAALGLEE
ncbi:MAG: DUF2339 domain-containing protein, partial [Planctomycetota bacterium]